MNLTFPNHFISNTSFKSLEIDNKRFIDYTHELSHIKDVQLRIEQAFLLYVFDGEVELMCGNGEKIYVDLLQKVGH